MTNIAPSGPIPKAEKIFPEFLINSKARYRQEILYIFSNWTKAVDNG
ncbi:hypothetical protein ACFLZW_06825 [Chloroflexota bacterium]